MCAEFEPVKANSQAWGRVREYEGDPDDLKRFSYRPTERPLVKAAIVVLRATVRSVTKSWTGGVYEGLRTEDGLEVQIHHGYGRRDEPWWSIRIAGRGEGQTETNWQTNYDFYGDSGIAYHIPDTNALYQRNQNLHFQAGSASNDETRAAEGYLMSHGYGRRGWLAKWLFNDKGRAQQPDFQSISKVLNRAEFTHVRKITPEIIFNEIIPLLKRVNTTE